MERARAVYWSGGDFYRQSGHDSIGVTDNMLVDRRN